MSVFDLTLPAQSRGLSGLFACALRTAAHSAELRRQRAALRRLDSRALADIGLTRDEAEAEARRLLWDAPSYWWTR